MNVKFLFFVFLPLFFLTATLFAATDKVSVEADKISYKDNNTIQAEGNVIIYYKDILLTANSITYNRDSNFAVAIGNVTLNNKDSYINADRMELDLEYDTGYIENGSGYYYPDKYFRASGMRKIGANNYILDNATITTCEGEKPDWSFSAKKAHIEYGDKFVAKGVTGRIRNVPVLYFPYFAWPIKIKRESGFLVPNTGYSSKKGFFITPKYFLNLDVDKDMTFGVNYFDERGLQYLTEARYAKSDKENIYLAGEYINEYDTDSNKDDRWKIINKSNLFITDNLELRFNTNYVSDFRYRRDFDDYSINELEEFAENKYINEFRGNFYSKYLDASIRYRDDMHFYDLEDGFMKVHLIREPNFIIEKSYVDAKLFLIDYKLDYNNIKASRRVYDIESEHDTSLTDEFERYNGFVKLYKPVNLSFGVLTPSFTQYYTKWSHSKLGYNNIDETTRNDLLKIDKNSDSVMRNIYNFNIKLKLNELYKHYDSFSHYIYNTFEYNQTPYLKQDNFIRYLEDDVVDEENAYLYTLTNYLKAKDWNLRLEFIDGVDASSSDAILPFHDRLIYNYKNLLNYKHESKFDYYDGEITYFDNRAKLNFKRFYLSLNHLFDREILEYADDYLGSRNIIDYPREVIFREDVIGEENTQLRGTIGVNISRINFEFSAVSSDRHPHFGQKVFTDLKMNEFYIKTTYISKCWEFGVTYKNDKYDHLSYDEVDDNDEHTILFTITLRGLGGTERKIL
jgi:LPS-assembly protein